MARTNWTEAEIEAVVADYLDMLLKELARIPYRKADHWRRLLRRIDRTKGSIEYKYGNISAVMDRLGLPYVTGYQPYPNFQRALYEAVENRVWTDPDLLATLTGASAVLRETDLAASPPSGLPIEIHEAPVLTPLAPVSDRTIQNILRRAGDPAERDARNRNLGKAGEALVFEAEKWRLRQMGRPDLSARVRWTARDDGDGCGYDILSFRGHGREPSRERWLEVKTTTGSSTTPFFITRNELEVSRERPDAFRIVRLYDFARNPRGFHLEPPIDKRTHLEAATYRASF